MCKTLIHKGKRYYKRYSLIELLVGETHNQIINKKFADSGMAQQNVFDNGDF